MVLNPNFLLEMVAFADQVGWRNYLADVEFFQFQLRCRRQLSVFACLSKSTDLPMRNLAVLYSLLMPEHFR